MNWQNYSKFSSNPRRLVLICAAGVLIALAACTKKTADSTSKLNNAGVSGGSRLVPGMRKTWALHPMDQPGSVFHMEYSPNTSIVNLPTVGRTLRGVSEDRSIFLFEDSPELRAKLTPGKFVLFEGLDLRKVDALAVDPKSKNLIVGTETAPLNQALKSADIQWKTDVDFGELFSQLAAQSTSTQPQPNWLTQLASPSRWWDWLQPTVHAEISWDRIEGDAPVTADDFVTWNVHYLYTQNPDHSLNLDLHIVRKANGLDVDLSIKGKVSRFVQQVSFELTPEGNMREYFKNGDLHGDLDFAWVIQTDANKTPMNEVRLKLPGSVKIPLVKYTELPMSLEIGTALLFHPAFTTKDQVAKGTFHVTYGGDEGLQAAGSGIQIDGQAQGDGAIQNTFAFSPMASFGLVAAVAAPRIELRMGTEELWNMAGIPLNQNLTTTLSDVLLNNSFAGQWLKGKLGGNPLAIEGAAYFQLVVSTTAAHSGMLSLVPCQQFTMIATGQVGVDAQLFGNNTNWPPKDLFSKNIVQRNPENKICGGG